MSTNGLVFGICIYTNLFFIYWLFHITVINYVKCTLYLLSYGAITIGSFAAFISKHNMFVLCRSSIQNPTLKINLQLTRVRSVQNPDATDLHVTFLMIIVTNA